ncbi:MAG: MBL fold metallo-hydrolase [Acidobacteriota bacterium]|nr:MBL fold metallo-hydrolase [Blastocatellia bacterium]MDW8411594.1 MBL fold metallo-hydrolase [Acidobacteriota bacterium]
MPTELIVLGSGTGLPAADRGAAAYLLLQSNSVTMLDCGPGSSRRLPQVNIPLTDIDRIIISHFHVDHVCDLAAILFGLRITGTTRKPLEIIAPIGLKAHYDGLIKLFGKSIVSRHFELILTEIDVQNPTTLEREPFKLYARQAAHTFPSLSYRLETCDGCFAYSGDTDYCENLIEICSNADLALLECSTANEDKIAGHLTPQEVASIAASAGVKHLVLSHFYPVSFDKDIFGQCRKHFQGRLTLASDLMRIQLE